MLSLVFHEEPETPSTDDEQKLSRGQGALGPAFLRNRRFWKAREGPAAVGQACDAVCSPVPRVPAVQCQGQPAGVRRRGVSSHSIR